MPEVVIRRARVCERKLLEALQWRASLNNPGDGAALLAHPDAIELSLQQIEDGGVFAAELGGAVCGFAAIVVREDANSELDGLFVEPQAWRRGIGRALVDHCASAALRTGAQSLHVVGNPHAEGFYERCGFTLLGTKPMRFGVGLLMAKTLK